jgi:hypothetical protein
MGGGSYSSTKYSHAVVDLASRGATFAKSSSARATGNYTDLSEHLDPKKLKDGMRESCYTPGFNDATPIVIGIDATGSMDRVPFHVQAELPKLIDLIVEKEISDHPNVLFMAMDDENCVPNAAFQISQFEIESDKLLAALNDLIIPHMGGGNMGESYHLFYYALANHTKIECFDKNGEKGFAFLICDEEPYFDAGDYTKHGTTEAIALSVFGDTIQSEIAMLDSVKKAAERYHLFVLRPHHTSHGKNDKISKMWQDLLSKAGENPEHVLEIPDTDAIIPTMVMAVGRLVGINEDEMVALLKAKGATGIEHARVATSALVPVGAGSAVATGDSIPTGSDEGRPRL